MKDMITNKNITPGKEDYLKVLLELSGRGEVCSSEVAEVLGITKASVSCMMNHLKEEGYISKEKYGKVFLTENGFREAQKVKNRYNLLNLFFINILGVDAKTAAEDACRIEHIISTESLDKIGQRLQYR